VNERVLVVPADLVRAEAAGRVYWPGDEGFARRLNEAGCFAPRADVESDESLRQVIPYLVLRTRHDGRPASYFTYRRLSAGGEARLFDKHSLGVGGHINDERVHGGLSFAAEVLRPNWIAEGLQRELAEELELPEAANLGHLTLHGFLALEETPVDRVHVGVVVMVDLEAVPAAQCRIRETDRLAAVGWLSAAELERRAREVTFEGWSRTLIEAGLP
jgi:predicted NUDIX family phosphoesterase